MLKCRAIGVLKQIVQAGTAS